MKSENELSLAEKTALQMRILSARTEIFAAMDAHGTHQYMQYFKEFYPEILESDIYQAMNSRLVTEEITKVIEGVAKKLKKRFLNK